MSLSRGWGGGGGRSWKQLTLPRVGHVLKFIQCPQASREREKSLLQHELVQFIIISAYLGSITVGRPDPTGGTGHPAPGLRGFRSQQVLGCIPLFRAGSAQGCRGCLVSASCTGTARPAPPKSPAEGTCPLKAKGQRSPGAAWEDDMPVLPSRRVMLHKETPSCASAEAVAAWGWAESSCRISP